MNDINKIIRDREKNLEIKFIKGTGPGGQKINKTSSTCQLIDYTDPDLPIVIRSDSERSREQNLERAKQIWEDKIRKMFYEKPKRTINMEKEKKIKEKKDKVRLKEKKILSYKKINRKKLEEENI